MFFGLILYLNCSQNLTSDIFLDFVTFESQTPFRITLVEVLDQSNGTGGEVYGTSGGPSFRRVTLYFRELEEFSGIDFVVNIYGEPQINNDVFVGNLSDTAIHIHTFVLCYRNCVRRSFLKQKKNHFTAHRFILTLKSAITDILSGKESFQ